MDPSHEVFCAAMAKPLGVCIVIDQVLVVLDCLGNLAEVDEQIVEEVFVGLNEVEIVTWPLVHLGRDVLEVEILKCIVGRFLVDEVRFHLLVGERLLVLYDVAVLVSGSCIRDVL